MSTSRAVARDVLVRVDDGAYANLVLPDALRRSGLDARDRAFVTDLVAGTLRARRRVDAILAPHGRRRIDRLDPPVRATLRLGAYQLLRGVAPHAAVGETVAAAPARARGYVNSVLRRVAASGPPWPEPAGPGEALSYPDWIVTRLTEDLGADAAHAALVTQNEAPTLTLRPNRTRTTPDTLEAELRATGAAVHRGAVAPDALAVRGAGDPGALPAVRDGRATPQDQASQAVVTLVDAQPGERILDVAAAPGGKATGLAETVGDGLVVALDVHPGRLGLVTAAARRLGLAAVTPVLGDGRVLPVPRASVHRALVDAPCSGLGVLRRRAEARWRVAEPSAALIGLQVALVLAALDALRPGGRLVYSVCTLTAAETTGVAAAVLAAAGDTVRVGERPGPPWTPSGPGALLLPQAAGSDGMFVLTLERVPGAPGSGR